MDEVLAENARLRGENALLKAENARSKTKIAQLKAENARLKVATADLMDDLEEDEQAKSYDNDEAGGHVATDLQTKDAKMCINQSGKNKGSQTNAKTHCQGKCWMNPAHFDKNCSLTPKALTGEKSKLRQVGTEAEPKWELRGGKDRENKEKLLGTVSCPCSADGTPLTEEEAIRRIIGQVAAMGFPDQWVRPMFNQRSIGKKSYVEGLWNAKVAVSIVAMLKCWTKKCSGAASADEVQLNDFLKDAAGNLLDEGNSWGGGAAC